MICAGTIAAPACGFPAGLFIALHPVAHARTPGETHGAALALDVWTTGEHEGFAAGRPTDDLFLGPGLVPVALGDQRPHAEHRLLFDVHLARVVLRVFRPGWSHDRVGY